MSDKVKFEIAQKLLNAVKVLDTIETNPLNGTLLLNVAQQLTNEIATEPSVAKKEEISPAAPIQETQMVNKVTEMPKEETAEMSVCVGHRQPHDTMSPVCETHVVNLSEGTNSAGGCQDCQSECSVPAPAPTSAPNVSGEIEKDVQNLVSQIRNKLGKE